MDGYKGPTPHPQKIHEDLLIWFHCGKGFVVGIWRDTCKAILTFKKRASCGLSEKPPWRVF